MTCAFVAEAAVWEADWAGRRLPKLGERVVAGALGSQ